MIFSCRSGAAGELEQDERERTYSVLVPQWPGWSLCHFWFFLVARSPFSLEGQEGSREAILGLGECVSSPWGCVCESLLLFLESKVTAAAG